MGNDELALALNAALSLDPKFIEVVSGDGKTGAKLTVEAGPELTFSEPEAPPTGTRIWVRERSRDSTCRNASGALQARERPAATSKRCATAA